MSTTVSWSAAAGSTRAEASAAACGGPAAPARICRSFETPPLSAAAADGCSPRPTAAIQMEDAYPRVVEQGGHRRVARLGADERLPDADELPPCARADTARGAGYPHGNRLPGVDSMVPGLAGQVRRWGRACTGGRRSRHGGQAGAVWRCG